MTFSLKKINLSLLAQKLLFVVLFFYNVNSEGASSSRTLPQEKSLNNYKYYLTVCSIFNNEAPWLKEWIEYHILVGVEHFVLYNNQSTDNYLDILMPYIKTGKVSLINWPNGRQKKKEVWAWVNNTQIPAYMNCVQSMKGISRWVAFIDTDEFIVPRKHDNLTSFLNEYDSNPDLGGLTINWSCYGSSGIWDLPEKNLLIESLTRKDDGSHIWATVVKSIVRPEFVEGSDSPHFFKYQKGKFATNPNGELFKKHQPHCIDSIKINHYYMRTLNYFYNDKLEKKKKMDNKSLSNQEMSTLLTVGDKQEDPDKDIFRFVPALREALGF